MNTVRRIAKNTLVLTAADIISKILSFILVVYIARYLGDVGFGKYSFAFAFTSLFLILSDLGLGTVTIREVARDKSEASKYLGNTAIIKFFLSLLTFSLIFIVINLMNYPRDTTIAVYIIGLSLVIGSFSGVFRSMFHAFERMEYDALLAVMEKIIVVSLGVFVLLSGYGLVALVSVFLIGSIFNLSASVLVTFKKFARPKFEIDLSFWKNIIKESIPFATALIFVSIYFYIDSVMLSVMKGDAVVGWYNAAYNLLLALIFIPSIFMMAVFPVISGFFKTSKDSLKIVYEKSSKYLFTIALPIVVGTVLLAENIIYFIYGNVFSHSILALQILIWTFLLISVNAVLYNILGAINRQVTIMKVTAACAFVNVVLNLILIPKLSLIGASIATVATEIMLFVFYFYAVSTSVCILALHKIAFKPIIAASLMGVCVFYLREYNIFLVVLLAAIIYFVLLYALRAFTDEDLDLFRQAFLKG